MMLKEKSCIKGGRKRDLTNLEAQGTLNFYKQINPYLQIVENQLKCEQD